MRVLRRARAAALGLVLLILLALSVFPFQPCPPASAQSGGFLIVSITPSAGSVEGGDTVYLRVVNLPAEVPSEWEQDTPAATVTVEFSDGGGHRGTGEVTDVEKNRITVITPGGMVQGTYDVTVTVTYSGGTVEAELPAGFTFVIPETTPEIHSIDPDFGPLAGGTQVVITGDDFWSASTVGEAVYVLFGGVAAESVTVVDPTEIRAVTPPAETSGAVDVVVINPDGAQAVLRNGFVYLSSPPYLTSVTPASGTAGDTVRIAAANLAYRDEDLAAVQPEIVWVAEGGSERFEAMPVVALTDLGGGAWWVDARVPPLTPGAKKIRVRTAYGVSNSLDFTYLPATYLPPVVTGVDPNEGPARGGIQLTITGDNFQTGARVYIGDKELSETVVRRVYEITGRSPAGLLPGTKYPVRVVNPDGREGALPDAFYVYSEPSITQVSPATGSVDGGNIITVTGEDFYPGARVVLKTVTESVYVEAEEVTVVSSTELRFRLPAAQDASGQPLKLDPGEERQVDLVVINSDGGIATLDDGFTYRCPDETPSIDSVTPPWGPTDGGVEILISGSGFLPGARVFIGWEEAAVVQVAPASIRAVVPAQPEGKYDVTVMNDLDAGAAVLRDGFEYRQPRTQPEISSIYPNRGPNYQSILITIRGENFWPGAQVYFGPYPAASVEWRDTTVLKVYTPDPGDPSCQGLTDYLGSVDVRLVDPYGGTALVRNGFTFTRPATGYLPVIESISPARGSTQGGTQVVITGTNFFRGAEVYFDGLPSPSVEVVDENTVVAETPPHASGEVEVTLVNRDGGVATYYPFTYVAAGSPPEIEDVYPSVGRAMEETEVIITGSNFQPGARVYFGHTEATVREVGYYTILATAPALPEGSVKVRVVNPDFGEAVWDGYFVYQASVPRITAVNPNQGPKQGGYYVTVLGEDFRQDAAVYFGEEELTVVGITISEELCSVRVLVPEREGRAVGPVDVRVVNPDGAEAVLKNGFTYTSPASNPTIAGVTPDKGPTTGGIWVTISGTDLREEARVYFGGREASRVRFIDNQTLLVLIPAHPEGTVAVTVVNYDGGTATLDAAFTYVTPESSPRIDRVVPDRGPHVGGTSITIYGLDFRKDARVYIDGVLAKDVEVKSYKEITCVTPGGEPGKVDVTVVNPDQGACTASGAFTYVEVEVPTITGVEPDRGPKKGGTAITITGTGFASGARVCIGGKEALEVRVAGGTRITAVTPPGEPGRQDVRVENPDGGYAVLEGGFLYLGPPEEPGWLSASPVDERTVELEWEEVEFATAYEIFVAREDGGPYAFLDRTTATTYYATGLLPDQEYFFRVRAVNDQGISVLSEETWSWTDEAEEDEEDEASVPEERLEGNILYVTLTNGYAWRNLGSTLDLTQPAYAGAGGLLLRVPVSVALAYGRSLRVVGLRYSVEIPSAVFAPAQARRLSSAERAESALVLQLEEVPAAEAADLARQAPGRVISRMLRLTLRLEGAGNRSVLSDLGSYVPVTVAVDPNLARGRTVGLYRYRPERGWERLGGQPSPGWPQVTGSGNLTGIFAAVAETR